MVPPGTAANVARGPAGLAPLDGNREPHDAGPGRAGRPGRASDQAARRRPWCSSTDPGQRGWFAELMRSTIDRAGRTERRPLGPSGASWVIMGRKTGVAPSRPPCRDEPARRSRRSDRLLPPDGAARRRLRAEHVGPVCTEYLQNLTCRPLSVNSRPRSVSDNLTSNLRLEISVSLSTHPLTYSAAETCWDSGKRESGQTPDSTRF